MVDKILREIEKQLKDINEKMALPIDEFTAYDFSFNLGKQVRLMSLKLFIRKEMDDDGESDME